MIDVAINAILGPAIAATTVAAYGVAAGLGLVVLIVAMMPRRQSYLDERIAEAEHVIGDGAWLATRAEYPKSARVRDIEPRGA